MENQETNTPPRFMMAFFRWFCHPDLCEEIEGDLLEKFHKHSEQYGLKKARMVFNKEVLLLFRPGIIGNIHHLTFKLFPNMKKLRWLQLVAFNLVIIVCMILPFLPGPYDKLSNGLSAAAQLIGFAGLLLVPIGILWLIQEIKKITVNNTNLNNWSSGYYYAISAAIICIFISLILLLALLIAVGPSAAAIGVVVIAFATYRIIFAVKKLRTKADNKFNAAPLYLLSVPIIAFTVYMFLLGPVSTFGRNYAIRQGQKLIYAIEDYYEQKGDYPESIDNLYYIYHIPKPSVMGVDEFRYERNGKAYNLSFVQWQHIGATREVVMYNKNNEHNVKGHFASYTAKQPYWRYYWLD